jgi:beta-galactosidase/beta-glucuronidase
MAAFSHQWGQPAPRSRPLVAAFNVRAMERQLEIMKELGCNAIRNSHNVASPELAGTCDKMGFIVSTSAFENGTIKRHHPETDFIIRRTQTTVIF